MTVRIAEIEDADVEQVLDLWDSCGLTRPWNDARADLAAARTTETATVLVAREEAGAAADGGRGPAVGTVMAGYDGHRGWLYYVAVDPSRQGTGIGRSLVVAAEAWLVAQGAVKIQLMVRSTNEGVAGFYAALGYTDAGCAVLGRRVDQPS
ncbi:GNAT family acetyltransferase [Sanguibacter suaedae]|uniref:GNAT family acetyltransferase n=1 Tax=Sanguibacter suaedae TaxID=2795737 RepID=A0A934M905_9MICO|nr:GNAT family acetyltransferase [Sanguibacter suaedae]MBI9114100.1 GNAT family acetyltransferase [Sanguibacter suaedae]